MLAEKVDRALWNNGVLRSTDYGEIDVAVKGRIVFLSGHVISTGNQQLAETAARTIPGVLDVKNDLVPDDNLIREVAAALGKIEHAYGVKFFTGAQNGVVVLNGEVSSTDIRTLAEKCAADIPGVRGVINYVRSPEIDLRTEDQRFLQPGIGEQIYFRDGLCGTVQRVVINPNNRRVVSMIVQRQISNHQSELGSLMGGKTLLPEGLVIIPMNIIRYMTRSSGYLHIHSADTAKYSDFDPAFFIAPEKAWTPPYPYCQDDVLFQVESFDEMNRTERAPANIPEMFPWIQPVMQSVVPESKVNIIIKNSEGRGELTPLRLRIRRFKQRTKNS